MKFFPIDPGGGLGLCTIKITSGDKENTFMELVRYIPSQLRYPRERKDHTEIPDEVLCKMMGVNDLSPLMSGQIQSNNHPYHDMYKKLLASVDKYFRGY